MNIRTLASMASGLLAVAASAQTRYTIQDLGAAARPAGNVPQSRGYALNDSGLVVGSSNVNNPLGNTYPYRFDGGPAGVPTPNASTYGFAYGVNDSGSIVGISRPSGGSTRAFIADASGTTRELGSLAAGKYSYAQGINDSGTVVGYSNGLSAGVARGFLWNSSTNAFTQLGTIAGTAGSTGTAYAVNASGVAVGDSDAANGVRRATVYNADGTVLDLGALAVAQGLGAASLGSIAYGINAAGDVVGRFYTSTSSYGAFVYRAATGRFTNLGGAAYAYGVNAAGTVVGTRGDGAFVAQGETSYSLLGLVDNAAALGFSSLVEARGINASGQITGWGEVRQADGSTQYRAYLLTPQAVPEPATMAALGLGAFALARRRRIGSPT